MSRYDRYELSWDPRKLCRTAVFDRISDIEEKLTLTDHQIKNGMDFKFA